MAGEYIRGQLLSEEPNERVYLSLNNSTGEFQTVTKIHSLDNQKSAGLLQSLSDLAAKNLRHPNIIIYLGHSQSDSSVIILSEYVIGYGSIAIYVQEHGKLEESVASSFTRQILTGLVYLDEQGVSVGNLSARNILVDLDGTVKIAHYGLPAEKGMGAKAYFWALGIIVLEMLTDYSLWSEATRSLHEDDKIPEKILATVDTLSSDFVTKCLSIDPSAARLTALNSLRDHPFCAIDKDFKFEDTKLYKKILDSTNQISLVELGHNSLETIANHGMHDDQDLFP